MNNVFVTFYMLNVVVMVKIVFGGSLGVLVVQGPQATLATQGRGTVPGSDSPGFHPGGPGASWVHGYPKRGHLSWVRLTRDFQTSALGTRIP